MNDKFNKIIESAKTFSLTKEEKETMLGKVSLFVKENPIGYASTPLDTQIPTPYTEYVMDSDSFRHKGIWGNNSKLFPSLSGLIMNNKFMPIILLLLMLGGGTSFAANSALPGDVLYPVKVHVNENVKSAFTFGASANGRVEAEHASERLSETEKLAIEGEISVEKKEKIKESFSAHANKVKKIVADMEIEGDVEGSLSVNSDLESKLQAHSAILSSIAENDEEDKESLNEVNAKVRTFLSETVKARSKSEASVGASADGKAKVKARALLRKEQKAKVILDSENSLKIKVDDSLKLETDTEVKEESSVDNNEQNESSNKTEINANTEVNGEVEINVDGAASGSVNLGL